MSKKLKAFLRDLATLPLILMDYQFTITGQKLYKTLLFLSIFLTARRPASERTARHLAASDDDKACYFGTSRIDTLPQTHGFTPVLNNSHSKSLNSWLETCEAAARAGGEQLRAWQGRFQTRQKGVRDLVTDADLASQEAIYGVIKARFPDHEFLGEEQAVESISPNEGQLTWIVDPLDGTTNYVHGYPNFAVSVAIARGNEVQAGVIYDPTRDECFAAA